MKIRRILIAFLIGAGLAALSEFFALPWQVAAVISGVVAGAICASLLDASLTALAVAMVVYDFPLLLRTTYAQGTKLLDIVSSASGLPSGALLGMAAIAFVAISVLTSLAVESALNIVRGK